MKNISPVRDPDGWPDAGMAAVLPVTAVVGIRAVAAVAGPSSSIPANGGGAAWMGWPAR